MLSALLLFIILSLCLSFSPSISPFLSVTSTPHPDETPLPSFNRICLHNSFKISCIAKQVRSCARAVDFNSGTKCSSRMSRPKVSAVSPQGGVFSFSHATKTFRDFLRDSGSVVESPPRGFCRLIFEEGSMMCSLAGSIAPSSPMGGSVVLDVDED